jgi:hypothetical protein
MLLAGRTSNQLQSYERAGLICPFRQGNIILYSWQQIVAMTLLDSLRQEALDCITVVGIITNQLSAPRLEIALYVIERRALWGEDAIASYLKRHTSKQLSIRIDCVSVSRWSAAIADIRKRAKKGLSTLSLPERVDRLVVCDRAASY